MEEKQDGKPSRTSLRKEREKRMNYKKQFEEFLADDLDSFTQMYMTSKWRIGIDIMKSEESSEIILHRFRFQRINSRQFEHSKAYYEEANVKMKRGKER